MYGNTVGEDAPFIDDPDPNHQAGLATGVAPCPIPQPALQHPPLRPPPSVPPSETNLIPNLTLDLKLYGPDPVEEHLPEGGVAVLELGELVAGEASG
jgi:hypothetical protein